MKRVFADCRIKRYGPDSWDEAVLVALSRIRPQPCSRVALDIGILCCSCCDACATGVRSTKDRQSRQDPIVEVKLVCSLELVSRDGAVERNSNELCPVMVREGAAQGSFLFETVCLCVLEDDQTS